ncbi:MAG: hypothetical protein ACOX81_06105 [Candidatus Heteroscillospira sp.]|jgi:hypothetical protein
MSNFGAVEKFLKDSGRAGNLMNAVSGEDAKKLESMVDKEKLNNALAKGDVQTLEGILRQVLNTGEGKALAQKISGMMGK